MTLSTGTLRQGLQRFVDHPYANEGAAIDGHAQAVRSYFQGAVGPTAGGTSTLFTGAGLDNAARAFRAAAQGQSTSAAAIVRAYEAFARVAAQGRTSAFTALVPPSAPLSFHPAPGDLDDFVRRVHAWAITGATTAPGSPSPIVGVWG